MRYLYAAEQNNYGDYASGRVLYNAPGTAPFPVRLGSEIFERCRAALIQNGIAGPFTLYDPFCGGAYLLTAIGFMHGEHIKRIIASDIEAKMVLLASQNLGLLNMDGLNCRMKQLERLIGDYGKESHKDALESAVRIKNLLEMRGRSIEINCLCADAKELQKYEDKLSEVDMVITDLPYGQLTDWSGLTDGQDHVSGFLESLHGVLASQSVVAVVADKKQKIRHSLFERVGWFNVGKRQVTILKTGHKM